MALKKITDADLEGKGVRGQPDVPGLTAEEMQRAVEQIVREVVIPVLNGNVDEINTNYATKSDLYTHPTYTARASGFYKITVDGLGHVSDVSAVEKKDVTDLGIAESGHSHTKSQITDFPATMPPSAHSHSKSEINDFPATMPPSFHTHTKSDITDFPESMPASDVSDWAKATTKPTYTASEVGATPQIKKVSISLSADGWSGDGPFSQGVTLSDITENSKVDLQPDSEVLNQLISDGVSALYVQNVSGTLTAYATGAKPTAALTIQATVTEVAG